MLPTLFKKGNLKETKWSPKQAVLDEQIPLDYIVDWFKQRLKKNSSPADRILVLKSATGSGKSAVLPPELYHVFFEEMRKDIACLQPQVYNAIDIPTNSVIPFHTKEALKKAGKPNREPLELGENIGYQTGAVALQPTRGVIYLTVGTLMQQINVMSDEDFMSKYGFVIIDEAHKRSISTDMVMKSMKMFIERNYKNPKCPFMIITSATFNTKKYCDYILSSVKAPTRYANIIDVAGQTTYPIHETFLPYDCKDVLKAAVDTVVKIHTENEHDFLGRPRGGDEMMLKKDREAQKIIDTQYRDILIFVAGSSDIKRLHGDITDLNKSHEFFKKYPVLPLKLTGQVVRSREPDYQNLNKDITQLNVEIVTGDNHISIKKPTRRVIIATNVGETGITYPALKYVIDTGFRKSAEYNPTFGTDGLIVKPVTKGIHTQRMGRAGRRAEGYSYPLFTEKTYEALLGDEQPDIIKLDIALDILNMLIQEVDPDNELNSYELADIFGPADPKARFEIKNFRKEFTASIHKRSIDLTKMDLLDLPAADSLHAAVEKLYYLGSIDSNCVPTPVGFTMNRFRKISPESIRMILAGYAWNAPIIDLVTIASMLSIGNIQVRSRSVLKEVQHHNRLGALWMTEKEKQLFPGYAALRNSLLIADDFINNLIIFHEFQTHLQDKIESADLHDLASLEEWCATRGINFQSIADAAALRDEVLQMLVGAGLNPFQNNQKNIASILNCYDNCSRESLLGYVKNIKQCIFEGYKLNIAEWNPSTKAYISRQTHMFLPIVSSLVASKKDVVTEGDHNPKYIIYDKIRMQQNPTTNTYRADVGSISIMDGYVSIDPQFD